MTGFEPGSPGIGSDRAVNCATTTAHCFILVVKDIAFGILESHWIKLGCLTHL